MIDPTLNPDPIEADAELLLELAIAHLKRRLGTDQLEFVVVSVEANDWPDASLGCPQKGIAYAQVVTPGYQILIQAEDKLFVYHTDSKDQVFLCQAQGPDEIYLDPY